MTKSKEIFLLLLSDFIFVNLAWSLYYYIRIETGWIAYISITQFSLPLLIVYVYWLIIFTVAGLYQHWFVRSRFDEFVAVVKVISLGCFILFFAIFIDDAITNTKAISRYLILIYWSLMIIAVGSGRILIRSVQIGLLDRGIGFRKSLIVGEGQKASNLESLIKKYPQLGYEVIGFVSAGSYERESLGRISDLTELINQYEITEILIALETKERDRLFEVIEHSQNSKVNLKIMPDSYDIVSGTVKTNQIYGVPLIEVLPEIMSYPSKIIKRFLDLSISIIILLLFSPLFVLVSLLIKLTSSGPVFYNQIRVGKNGKEFTMYKFRTMIQNAEEYGPEWAGERDPRITFIGRIIRKLYLDEIPQMINILKNEMSLVGPRPERPHFVEMLKKEISYYYKRLSVKPGITGWAQIKHKYDSTLDDVRVKLQYDFYYIENMSLKLDFKIMVNTMIVIILMKGH